MTNPIILPSDFKDKIILPNDTDKLLKIINENPDIGKANKGKRRISLFDSVSLLNTYSEEIIYSPNWMFEFAWDEDTPEDEQIIQSFHTDNIEFI